MPNRESEILIRVRVDSETKAIKSVKTEMKGLNEETDKASKGARQWGLKAAAAGGIAVVAMREVYQRVRAVASEQFRIAAGAEETASKYRTVLGPAIGTTNRFLERNATMMGLSVTKGREMVATTAAISQGMGFSQTASASFASEIVKLAGDLQSFNDVPIEQTHRAITAALAGERESLKTLGIVIREVDVQQKALNQTGKQRADDLTQQEKATATLALITEKAGVAVGDLERTMDSDANQARQLNAVYQDIRETLAKRLLPAFGEGISAGRQMAETFQDFIEIPLSATLKDEQTQLNVLVSRITDANTSQDKRNELITSLNTEYPGFLGNLDAETASNEQLAERLGEVNELYVKRIALQAQEEQISEAVAEKSDALRRQFELEAKIRSQIIELNDKHSLGLQTTGVSFDELVSSAERALESTSNMTRAELEGTTVINRMGDTVGGLRGMLAQYNGAQKDVEETTRAINDEMEMGNQIAAQFGTTLAQVEEQMGAGAAPEGGEVEFTTSIDRAGLAEMPTISGEGSVNIKQAEEEREIREAAAQRELELRQRIIDKTVQAGEHEKTLTQIATQGAAERSKGLSLTADQWETVSANAGQAAAQNIMYAETAKEAIKGVIEGLINQMVALWVRNALQTAGASGPLAFAVSPVLAAAAVKAAKALTKPLLNFEQGGLLKGPRHSGGGIKASLPGGGLIEMEGDEFVVNRRSTRRSLRVLRRMNDDPGYAAAVDNVVGGGVGAANGGRGSDQDLAGQVRAGIESAVIRPSWNIDPVDEASQKNTKKKELIGHG